MRRHYVYYRVTVGHLDAAVAAAQALQSALCAEHPGLDAELLRRPEVADGRATLMEVYRRAPQGVDAALATAIEQRAVPALAAWVDGARHVESFDLLR